MMNKIIPTCFKQPAAKTTSFVIPVVRKDWKKRIASMLLLLNRNTKDLKLKIPKNKRCCKLLSKFSKIYGAGVLKGWMNNINVQNQRIEKSCLQTS